MNFFEMVWGGKLKPVKRDMPAPRTEPIVSYELSFNTANPEYDETLIEPALMFHDYCFLVRLRDGDPMWLQSTKRNSTNNRSSYKYAIQIYFEKGWVSSPNKPIVTAKGQVALEEYELHETFGHYGSRWS